MGRKAQKAKKKQAWENSDDDEEHEENEEETKSSESESDEEETTTQQQQSKKNNNKKAGGKKGGKQQQQSKAQEQQEKSAESGASAAAAATTSSSSRKPVNVIYCPISKWPAEMCEYNGEFAKCKQWHIDHAEELKIENVEELENGGGEKGRKQKLPGDEVLLGNPNKKNQVKELTIDIRKRTGRKKTTLIKGLEYWGIQPNPVAQLLKKKFSCGTAVIDPPSSGMPATVEVQGENTDQLIALLTGKDYNIPNESIVMLREGKPLRAKTGGAGGAQESSSDDEEDSSNQASAVSSKNQTTEDLLAGAPSNRDAPAPRPKGKKPHGKKK